MAHRLRMSAELGDWLAELCTSEPASAAEVAAALVSVMTADDPASLPIVGEAPSGAPDPRFVLDRAYQDMLEALQSVRHHVAVVATDRKRSAKRLDEAEAAGQPDEILAQLLRRLAELQRREHALSERSQRIQRDVDAFRTAKETAKAMYTAAEATLRIHEAIDAVTGESPVPESSVPDDDNEETEEARAFAAAAASLQAVAAQAARTLREVRDSAGGLTGKTQDERMPLAPSEPVAGLLELRADPLGRDVRLLLALEPADAVTLLAVLDGEDAIAEHQAQAIELAGGLLTDIRAGAWPPDDALGAADLEVTFADSATFLARFFPADSGAIPERADALGAAQTLAGLRSSNGMSLPDLAAETGISGERLRFIEDGGLRAAQVHEVAAYVRALGGRLTLTAKIGESDPVVLA